MKILVTFQLPEKCAEALNEIIDFIAMEGD